MNAYSPQELINLKRKYILATTRSLFVEHWLDEISVQLIAERAEVSIQTLYRYFGSRETLLRNAISAALIEQPQRPQSAQQASLPEIMTDWIEFLEENGDLIIRLRAQAGRYPELDHWQKEWLKFHRRWVRESFAVYLQALYATNQASLEDLLLGITDLQFWHGYRRDLKKSAEDLLQAWVRVIRSVLMSYR